MPEKPSSVLVNELIATSAEGVLRALEARGTASQKLSVEDLVKSGFTVSIHIICGGINPGFLAQLRSGDAQ